VLLGPSIRRVFVSGGAGFIGSHVVDTLLPQGYDVTVIDNLSNGRREFLAPHLGQPRLRFIEGDLLDRERLVGAVGGHDLVWHLAANTDIIGSHEKPERDLRDCVMATFNVIEAMRQTGVRPILFASTGAVYGDLCREVATSEAAGPLLPISTYAAGKIGSEAFISSYCHVYGLRAWLFRFGNVIGARLTHGVIADFIGKLRRDPTELVILGDGRQEKNYFLVEECIEGMAFAFRTIPMTAEHPCDTFNLGTGTVSRVTDIARIVIEEMGLSGVKVRIAGTSRAWPGDQPRVHITVERMREHGWSARATSDQAVRIAVRRMLGKPDA
jgi:UDP-glucose 4-epimerase